MIDFAERSTGKPSVTYDLIREMPESEQMSTSFILANAPFALVHLPDA